MRLLLRWGVTPGKAATAFTASAFDPCGVASKPMSLVFPRRVLRTEYVHRFAKEAADGQFYYE
jgi:hypothetical protein